MLAVVWTILMLAVCVLNVLIQMIIGALRLRCKYEQLLIQLFGAQGGRNVLNDLLT